MILARQGTIRALALVLAIGALLGLLGCKDAGAQEPESYQVRGQVENIAEAKGKPVVLIHHEAIPDFVDGYGRKRTMNAMAMPFGLQGKVQASDMQVGDKVEIRFVIDRSQFPTFHITELRKLAADTKLDIQ